MLIERSPNTEEIETIEEKIIKVSKGNGKNKARIREAIKVKMNPPIAPSQVLLGLIIGANFILPISLPKK